MEKLNFHNFITDLNINFKNNEENLINWILNCWIKSKNVVTKEKLKNILGVIKCFLSRFNLITQKCLVVVHEVRGLEGHFWGACIPMSSETLWTL